jgi:tRNA splicing endonuclease
MVRKTMTTATLKWDFNGDEGVYEREDFQRCVQSLDLALSISSFLDLIKTKKYLIENDDSRSEEDVEREWDLYDKIHTEMYEILEDRGINIDGLLS